MPELPDVEVFSRNLNKIFAGQTITRVKVVNVKKLADSQGKFTKRLKGKKLSRIYRAGKEMRFEMADGTLLGLHLMLTGDIFLFDKKNERPSTIVELHFDSGQGLALTDRMKNANMRLDPVEKAGVDAISPQLNFKYLKAALQRKTSVKKVLTDQDAIRGIGNSYSDEILWLTRISPYAVANAIPDDKIKELVRVIKSTLKKEIKNIEKVQQGAVHGEVKAFLMIHSPKKLKSPTGAKIIVDKKGMMKTYYTKEQKMYK